MTNNEPDRNADRKNWFTAMKHYLQRKSQKDSIKHPHRVPAGDRPQVIKYVEGGEELPDTSIHVE